MTAATLIALLLAVACIGLSVWDIFSTFAFLAAGYPEKGWMGFMAWLQAKFPRGWPYIKVGATAAIALCLLALPEPIAQIALLIQALDLGYTVMSNYRLAAGK